MYYNAIVNCVHAFREKFKRGASKRIGGIMGITEILDSGADVTLKIKSKDLKDFADHLIEKSIKGVKESFVRPEERYLTIKEVAEKLHVDPSTLWSWDKKGYLRKIEVGGKRLYRESDVEAILNRK